MFYPKYFILTMVLFYFFPHNFFMCWRIQISGQICIKTKWNETVLTLKRVEWNLFYIPNAASGGQSMDGQISLKYKIWNGIETGIKTEFWETGYHNIFFTFCNQNRNHNRWFNKSVWKTETINDLPSILFW